MKMPKRHAGRLGAALLLAGLARYAPAAAQHGAANGEWRSYGGDTGSTKYSPLDQITPDNFEALEIAWRWRSVDSHLAKSEAGGAWIGPAREVFEALAREDPERWETDLYSPRPGTSLLVATPLMVDGVLYLSTPLYQAAAVDARTGETLWAFDPRAYESGTPAVIPWRHRGVAYWEAGGEARVVWATGDGYLIAVDARTGRPAADFGDGGRIDLMQGVPRASRESRTVQNLLALSSQSPPLVIRDTVLVGSSMTDMVITKEMPPGWVRAYDVRTGRHKWDFHTIPQSADEYGADTWLNQSWRYSGAANVWSLMSGDEELGYAYLPTGTPTGDYYGGHRPGDNLFAESLVCVDVETGERVWHFQAVHHGLWDYDFASAPNLIDIVVDGRPIRAVAQPSKQGFIYTFDRVTGEPVWPIEERPVPTDTDLVGEVAVADAALPDPARPRSSTRARRSTTWSTSPPANPADGRRGGRGLPAGPALHAELDAGDADPAQRRRRRQLVGRGGRSRDGAALRAVGEHALRSSRSRMSTRTARPRCATPGAGGRATAGR